MIGHSDLNRAATQVKTLDVQLELALFVSDNAQPELDRLAQPIRIALG